MTPTFKIQPVALHMFVFRLVCVFFFFCVCALVYVGRRACVPLASLVSHRVLNYPMGALIEPKTHLILRLDEGQIEGSKGGDEAELTRKIERAQHLLQRH